MVVVLGYLSIPLRMKQRNEELELQYAKAIFQFLWGWNNNNSNKNPRMKYHFQFLWGWNTKYENATSEDELSFQFLWGWNKPRGSGICQGSVGKLSIPLRMKQIQAIHSTVYNGLSIPLRMKHEGVSDYTHTFSKYTFNSFEDETWRVVFGHNKEDVYFQFLWGWNIFSSGVVFSLIFLSIPLRMKHENMEWITKWITTFNSFEDETRC